MREAIPGNGKRTEHPQTLERAIAVLDVLRDAGEPMRLTDVALRAGIGMAVAHRLLATLAAHGLADQDPTSRAYGLGWGLVSYAQSLQRSTQLSELAPPIARRLRDLSSETVTVQVPVGSDRVVIHESEGLHQVRRRVGVGSRLPIHASASGRAILAFLAEADIDRILDTDLRQVTAQTVVSRDELRRLLDQARRTGITRSRGESVLGVSAIATPIFRAGGVVAGSIAVSGPSERWEAVDTPSLEAALLEAGLDLSRRLGFLGEPAWIAAAGASRAR